MLRPAGCRIRFALLCEVSLAKPTVSRRSSPTCILSVSGTAKQHSVVPPTNQSASSSSAWVQAYWVVMFASFASFGRSVVTISLTLVLTPSDILLSTEQPESTPRVSYLTTQCPPIVGSISQSCVGWFLNCSLVAFGWENPRALPHRSPSPQTVLAGCDSTWLRKYPAAKVFTGSQPAPRGGRPP